MPTVNMHEAKSNLSKLVEAVESGAESEVIIARNGRPVARRVPVRRGDGQRIGAAKGVFVVPDTIDVANAEIEALFLAPDE